MKGRGLAASAAVAMTLLCALAAAPGHACTVCYGGDSQMTAGMNNAILTLLAVVVLVQGGFVALFLSFRRRARRIEERRSRFQLIDGGAG